MELSMSSIKTAINNKIAWSNIQKIESERFTCGYCNEKVSSNDGYSATRHIFENNKTKPIQFGRIYICHHCGKPNFIDASGVTHPGSSFGNEVNNISSAELNGLYTESRNCMKVNAFTASVMCSRKLLMNIAVDKGAKEGMKFVEYIDFLESKHYTPPNSAEWINVIRTVGNMANHEIKTITRNEAEKLIIFTEMLLKFNYEFPALSK